MKNRAVGLIVLVGLCLIATQSFGAFYWTGGSPPSGTTLTINADVYLYVIDKDVSGEPIVGLPNSAGDEIRGILKIRHISGPGSVDYWDSDDSTGELTGAIWGYAVTELTPFTGGAVVSLEGGVVKFFYDDSPSSGDVFDPSFNTSGPTAGEPSDGSSYPWDIIAHNATSGGHGAGFSDGTPWLDVNGVPFSGGTDPNNTMTLTFLESVAMAAGGGFAMIPSGGAGESVWDRDGADSTGTIAGIQDFKVTLTANVGANGSWSFYAEGANGLSFEGLFVPEPSTMTGLFTLGLALAGLVWRRRAGR